mmetsp:Transcript_15911/g.23631  ORF Transcript_15911/g.23631 Transcript_15911/m.23631 type:complete len:194 (-) Transcript_15911:123-704(-)|eukprot:CAMPEP_0171452650 /NCGR_PEP_ID=MMETSP0945-20130129/673_1 /TAXON_ID=109269 /ORGANISM="Vaucheria litorea, Strain CCMP2940" /LENGTH=193 /DNA_ID=CAMNT_0011977359 /DNA_START=94 /DNA_END=672 /DNA_ORIENTATION=-
MSVTGNSGIGLPVILLHDSEGAVCTVELKSGDLYRGILDEAEDNMNIMMKDVLKTDTTGKTYSIPKIYIRGTQIVLVIVPDMLKNAAMFRRIVTWRKYKGNPPSLASSVNTGQRAAILRKAAERMQLVRGITPIPPRGPSTSTSTAGSGGNYSIYGGGMNRGAPPPSGPSSNSGPYGGGSGFNASNQGNYGNW